MIIYAISAQVWNPADWRCSMVIIWKARFDMLWYAESLPTIAIFSDHLFIIMILIIIIPQEPLVEQSNRYSVSV